MPSKVDSIIRTLLFDLWSIVSILFIYDDNDLIVY